MTDRSAGAAGESARVADARSRAEHRLRRQRDTLRPLGLAVIVAVVAGAIDGNPAPGPHGEGLGVALALCVFAAALALAISGSFTARGRGLQVAVIVSMGAAGVALAALQARGVTALAGGAAVWMAVARLPLRLGVTLAGAVTIGLGLATAMSGSSSAAVVAALLLCALLGFMAYFVKQARASQDRTELLLAQLEDAREVSCGPRRSGSAPGSRVSCTTCSHTRSPVRRSSCKGLGSSQSESRRARRFAPRSTVPESW